MTRPIDWDATHSAVIKYLADKLIPCHYQHLYGETARLASTGRYSDKTDPAEKLRQYYAEHDRPDVTALPGGYIGLRRWFGPMRQMQLFQPGEYVRIKGNCLLSYDAGFEQAKRQPYMKDHFGDAQTDHRQRRRRTGALIEEHIRHYFKTHYAEFYQPPSNAGNYALAAPDDFKLNMGGKTALIDVKSWTGERGYVRNPKPDIVYLWADWLDEETIQLNGVTGGPWVQAIGETEDATLYHIQRQDVSSIDQFIVYLNMMQRGLDYRACRLSLLRDRPPRATIRRPMKGVITPADWPVLASGQRRTQEPNP